MAGNWRGRPDIDWLRPKADRLREIEEHYRQPGAKASPKRASKAQVLQAIKAAVDGSANSPSHVQLDTVFDIRHVPRVNGAPPPPVPPGKQVPPPGKQAPPVPPGKQVPSVPPGKLVPPVAPGKHVPPTTVPLGGNPPGGNPPRGNLTPGNPNWSDLQPLRHHLPVSNQQGIRDAIRSA